MLSQEDLALARKQLSEQIERLPDGQQKEAARKQLASMSDEAISAMVEQQNKSAGERAQKSIFRMIVSGEVSSRKIDENKEAIAVVSIRAVSKGHVIVIPKNAVKEEKNMPLEATSLAQSVAKRIIAKLKATKVDVLVSSAFDEYILNVIPTYDKKVDLSTPMYEVKEEELNEVYDKLKIVKKPKKEVIRIKKKKEGEIVRLPRRVP